MEEALMRWALLAVSFVFAAAFAYQGYYIIVSLLKKQPVFGPGKEHTYGVLIAARNEENVIGQLIGSLRAQDYPSDKIRVFVVADNCTDGTADVARRAGAIVYERFDRIRVGKGYALDELLGAMLGTSGKREDLRTEGFGGEDAAEKAARAAAACDGFFIFDADNLLDPQYVREMDKAFSAGFRVVTSYRNSKNYGDNWISAGYGLMFLREARYMNQARMELGTSCAVSGTGYLIAKEILIAQGGWPQHLLTEDIQFTVEQILKGERIGYCPKAVFYDEQPTDFKVSFHQRMRWSKGMLQVLRVHGGELLRRVVTMRDFASYDILIFLMQTVGMYVGCLLGILSAVRLFLTMGWGMLFCREVLEMAGRSVLSGYLGLLVIGGITLITEWKQIHTTAGRKIGYLLLFPIYTATYIPITVAATFGRVTWKPIPHKAVAARSATRAEL